MSGHSLDLLLSVDLGTTGCKAAVYTADGQLQGSSYLEYPLLRPRPGIAEQDAHDWQTLAQDALRAALAQAGADGQHARALGISAQGISFVPIDDTGNPLRRAISWLDVRATDEAAAIQEQVGDEALFQLTGKRPAAAYVLPKLLWLRRYEPAVYHRAARFLLAHDYLLHKLCGANLTDYSLAGGTLLLDLQQLDWSAQLLAAFSISRQQLPSLAWGGTLAGSLLPEVARALGLSAGLTVVVGGQDQKCACLGAGIRPGRVALSLGTAAAISCLVTEPVLDPERRIPLFPFVVPGYWVLEGVVGAAGAALKWARETLFPGCSYSELDALAAQSPPGANGVRFYPHLAGATSPLWLAQAQGAFTGLSLAAGAADIVRSILEGVAFQVQANLEIIAPLAGKAIAELVLFGGGARSALWAEIISQVTARPVYAPPIVDVANWGACILAATGAGIFPQTLDSVPAGELLLKSTPSTDAVDRYQSIRADYRQGEQSLYPAGQPFGARP